MTEIIGTVRPNAPEKFLGQFDVLRLHTNRYGVNVWPDNIFRHRVMIDVGQVIKLDLSEPLPVGDKEKLVIQLEPRSGIIGFDRTFDVSRLNVGDRVLIKDGDIFGRVSEKDNNSIKVEIQWKKGPDVDLFRATFNFPDSNFPKFYLSEDDQRAIKLSWERKVFMLALSNVEIAEDVLGAIDPHLGTPGPERIVLKIETRAGVENLNRTTTILKSNLEIPIVAMSARGDLFNEVGPLEYPFAQDKIISICEDRGIPIIIATGLLESMLYHRFPSHPEAESLKYWLDKRVAYLMLARELSSKGIDNQAVIQFLRNFIKKWQENQ